MSFLTVEDVNSVQYGNQGFYWVEIDTSKISTESDFTDVKYDFCEVSRETNTSTTPITYNYTFKIAHSQWTKGFYVLRINGNAANPMTFTVSGDTLSFASTQSAIRLFLYMGPIAYDNGIQFDYRLSNGPLGRSVWNFTYRELNTPHRVDFMDITGSNVMYKNYNLVKGYNSLTDQLTPPSPIGYVLVNLIKSNFGFNCNQTLKLGKINRVALGTLTDYQPNGAMMGAYTPTITVEYKGETIPVEYDTDDYYFNLDLTDITEPKRIKFKVKVEANEVLNESETSITLQADYDEITTFNNFKSSCETTGNDIIKLSNDITSTSTITINHDILIIGDDNTLDLDSNNIIISDNATVKIQDLNITNGDIAILQKEGSTLELTNCTFTNCTSTDNNGLGSCISCDIDYESIANPNDFTTIIDNCLFTNNHNCILHGGQLQINNSRYHNTDLTYHDKGNSAFLYQTDGTATITGSVFDIDYTATTLCTNEENIGYGQALLMFGETAIINNQTVNDVKANDKLQFFTDYNNRSHIYAKYYYPQIEACVYSSPATGKEDQCIAWAISGVNYIFRTNLQITRNNPNETRKITW